MAKVILTCSCGATPRYCENTYKILYPDTRVPKLYVKSRIRLLLSSLPNPSEAYTQAENLSHKRGRFGYLMEYTEDGEITRFYDLLKNQEVL